MIMHRLQVEDCFKWQKPCPKTNAYKNLGIKINNAIDIKLLQEEKKRLVRNNR